jgi:hypothetical protein
VSEAIKDANENISVESQKDRVEFMRGRLNNQIRDYKEAKAETPGQKAARAAKQLQSAESLKSKITWSYLELLDQKATVKYSEKADKAVKDGKAASVREKMGEKMKYPIDDGGITIPKLR